MSLIYFWDKWKWEVHQKACLACLYLDIVRNQYFLIRLGHGFSYLKQTSFWSPLQSGDISNSDIPDSVDVWTRNKKKKKIITNIC